MSKVKFILNGEPTVIAAQTSLLELIKNLELDSKKIAIEKDLEIVNPQNFSQIIIDEGSRIEIVHFIGGG